MKTRGIWVLALAFLVVAGVALAGCDKSAEIDEEPGTTDERNAVADSTPVGGEWPEDPTKPAVLQLSDGKTGALGTLQYQRSFGWVIVASTPADPIANPQVLAVLADRDASDPELGELGSGSYVWAVGDTSGDTEEMPVRLVDSIVTIMDIPWSSSGGDGQSSDSSPGTAGEADADVVLELTMRGADKEMASDGVAGLTDLLYGTLTGIGLKYGDIKTQPQEIQMTSEGYLAKNRILVTLSSGVTKDQVVKAASIAGAKVVQ